MRKAPKRITNPRMLSLVDPTDVLVCARLSKTLPRERLASATCKFFKLAFIEEGRLLGYSSGEDYVLVANLLDEASAGRFHSNLAANPSEDLVLCATESNSAKQVKPWGAVAPEYLVRAVTSMLSTDMDVRKATMDKIAQRMDRAPEGDYIFPNLAPEVYRAVKDELKKKPQ